MPRGMESRLAAISAALADHAGGPSVLRLVRGLVKANADTFSRSLPMHSGMNVMSPAAARHLGDASLCRPSVGKIGEKVEPGADVADELETVTSSLLKQLFQCKFAEHGFQSGTQALAAAMRVLCMPGDTIMTMPTRGGGFPTHGKRGVPELMGIKVLPIPWDIDANRMNVTWMRGKLLMGRAKAVVLGGDVQHGESLPFQSLYMAAKQLGAHVIVDASHIASLIAGGAYSNPLVGDGGVGNGVEGMADVVISSTSRNFPGPPGGIALTNNEAVHRGLQDVTFPALTSSTMSNRTAALAVATNEMLRYGESYASLQIANAQALASELRSEGVEVSPVGISHQVVLNTDVSSELERAGILCANVGLPTDTFSDPYGGTCLSTQEISRIGMKPEDMGPIATCILRITRGEKPENVLPDVRAIRAKFQKVEFWDAEDAEDVLGEIEVKA